MLANRRAPPNTWIRACSKLVKSWLSAERRDALVDALSAGRKAGLPLEWNVPDGGMSLWLDCGVNSDALAREADARRVFVHPESRYRFPGTGAGTHLRLGYASQSPQEIRAGVRLLFEAIESVRRESRGRKPPGAIQPA